ncbi:alpha/beta hydrolase family protein [Parahaliea mediterranea]|uniref:S9 family peptidase n=1 Tax=Parahaliea mediterranea TaxID=651086 RepID=A0A939DDM4_9GAMM|nr:S9 family peptidase [Parahaliea mediterranea]MBN7796119.1 S9 family peptidase [Parahaliea mediterranea]
MRYACLLLLCCLVSPEPGVAGGLDLDELIRKPQYSQPRISPDGEKLAVVSVEEGQRVLALMTLDPLEITYVLRFVEGQEVGEYYWVNEDRVVSTVWEQKGWLDTKRQMSALYAVDYDGGRRDIVFGYQVGYNNQATASRIKRQQVHTAHADIISILPEDDSHVLISTYPWEARGSRWWFTGETFGEVLKLNVYNGRTRKVADLPARGGRAYADPAGELRFADGHDGEGRREFYQYRDGEWRQLGDPQGDYHAHPTGYSADGQYAYLLARAGSDREELLRFDLEAGTSTSLHAHPKVDVEGVGSYPGSGEPMVVHLEDGAPTSHYLDPQHRVSRYLANFHQAFPGYRIRVESETPDGQRLIVSVSGDNQPGEFFLADLEDGSARRLLSAASWLPTDKLARSEPFEFDARDGLRLQGFLTYPASGRSDLPMIVLPHGGPSARDYWAYDPEAQILAGAGYLVMQVNFRGSTGYGEDFQSASHGQWGGAVQNDIADATRWVIERGYADRERVCIYGASFGAYSAMMSVIREPDLYQCAAGFAGVYDLQMMYERGDIRQRRAGQAYLEEALGTDEAELAAASPARNAERISVPVFIAHGGEDQRAPIEHARALEQALREAGVPVQTEYYDKGGHGYNSPQASRALYTGLLAFFARHIGP